MDSELEIEVRKSSISGVGIFAKRQFAPGEVVLRWKIPELIPKSRIDEVSSDERHYLMDFDEEHLFVVQPPERYINHSCEPNTRMGERCDIAIRRINVGEEITSDYGASSYVRFKCSCGAKSCKGEIGSAK